MSEPLTCEYCGSLSKNKPALTIHHKQTNKCIKKQIEKLGKPLYEASLKKIENPKPMGRPKESKKEVKQEEIKQEESEEEDEFEYESSDESDIDIKISSDEESEPEISFTEEPVKSKFSNSNLFKKPKEEPENSNTDTKDIESKLNLILNSLNNKDNKVLDEIKKLREDLKIKEEEAQKRDEQIKKMINKLEKNIGENNPVTIIEVIKRIQAEVESKDELLQIFKEDLEETLEKYYELYKKLKDIKYDMEEMVYGDKK